MLSAGRTACAPPLRESAVWVWVDDPERSDSIDGINGLSRTYRRLRSWSWPRRYPVAQFPNPPLIVALVAFALRWITPGSWANALTAIGYVFLGAWAYLELAEGVNGFRRVLGAAALVYVIVLITRQLAG